MLHLFVAVVAVNLLFLSIRALIRRRRRTRTKWRVEAESARRVGKIRPLHLPRWSRVERFLGGIPIVGASVEETVRDQLAARDDSYIAAWESTADDVDLHLAFRVAAILRSAQRLPNDYFVPNDPCGLLFVDDCDALTPNHLVREIERQLGVEVSEECWTAIESSTFAAFIRALGACR